MKGVLIMLELRINIFKLFLLSVGRMSILYKSSFYMFCFHHLNLWVLY